MNFHYSTSNYNTTYRPQNSHSTFNEDAHCDNEVNLILEKNYNQNLLEQSPDKLFYKNQQSTVVNQTTDQYYFMPIRDQNSTTAVAENHVTDSSSLLFLLSDLQHPSTLNLFDDSSPTYFSSNMNLSDNPTTVKKSNNYTLTDADLSALFTSSIVPTTPPSPTQQITSNHHSIDNGNSESLNHILDDVSLNSITGLVSITDKQQVRPPPGFENFLFESPSVTNTDLLLSQTTNNHHPNSTLSSSSNAAIVTPVSSSDTINFSQLLQSTSVDIQEQQQLIVGNVGNIRSPSSSHSPFTSDEQSIFFPMSTHPYSSSSSIIHATSQIFSTNTPLSSTTTIMNSAAKPHIPNSLSLHNNNQFSSSTSASLIPTSTTNSPISTTIENEKHIKDGDITSNHLFSSTNSFFSNGHKDFTSSKSTNNKNFPTNRQSSVPARTSSSSASSSTSSSVDEALIQLTQQHHQQHLPNINKLFNDEPSSIFHFSSLPPNTDLNKQQQQQVVHDNINLLASMATASTPVPSEPSWQQTTSLDSSINLQRQMRAMALQQQQQQQINISQPSTIRNNSVNMQELMQYLNELCYKGFDELNALIQEQRWVQTYVNMNSSTISSPSSPSVNLNNSNCCSSRILIVPEYFIFKCKKVEGTASHVFELLAVSKPELRLRDLMFVFKSWKESILNAELIHQEEENKLRLSTDHPQSYYMTDNSLQSVFDRMTNSIRQLCNFTQQVRAAFQYATLNVFQSSSRQQQQIQSQSLTSNTLAQLQLMQQQKS